MIHTFAPHWRRVSLFTGSASGWDLLNEQGMYAASEEFAQEHAGPLTRNMLAAIPAWYRQEAAHSGLELNIDVRIHQLHVGWYPAAPGWHCDASQRETQFSDDAPRRPVNMSLIGMMSSSRGGVSNTELTVEDVTFESPHEAHDADLWADMDAHLNANPPLSVHGNDGEWILFDPFTAHRASPARVTGVRLFCRVSRWQPPATPAAGLTKNEQAYIAVRPLRQEGPHATSPTR